MRESGADLSAIPSGFVGLRLPASLRPVQLDLSSRRVYVALNRALLCWEKD